MQTGIRFSFSVLGLQQLDAKPRCHDQLARIALGLAAHTTPTVSFIRDYWRFDVLEGIARWQSTINLR